MVNARFTSYSETSMSAASLRGVMDERVRLLEDLANPVRYGVLTRLENGPGDRVGAGRALGVSADGARQPPAAPARARARRRPPRRAATPTYELAEPGLRELFSVLNELRDDRAADAPDRPPSTRRRHLLRPPLRAARGRAVRRARRAGALVPGRGGVTLGEGAEAALARFGVAVPAARRRLMAYPCLDALRGPAAPRRRAGRRAGPALVERGWVETQPGTRAASVTPAGRRGLRRLLGAQLA